jgi:AraC-like DNA-binding protein
MLTASGGTTFGSARMRSRLMFERRFFTHVVERRGLTFDARFVPPAERPSRNVVLYLLAAGEFTIREPEEMRLSAPVSFLIAEDDYEGAGHKRALSFRAAGDPFVAIDLRLDQEDVTAASMVGTGDTDGARAPRLVELDALAWSAARQVIDADDATAATAGARALMTALERLGVVRRGVAATIDDGDERFARLWTAIAPMIARYHPLPTLQELALGAALSLRHAARETKAFVESLRMVGSSWRETTRRSRLKLAVLGLSSHDATVGEVARVAGYGSTDAMARAFRDAGLPAPSAVQQALRAPSS